MYTPLKREPSNVVNEMAYQTPQIQTSFSRELSQVLQERNLFTAKSRNKVCAMLNGSVYMSNNSTPIGTPNPEVDKRRSFRLQAVEEILNSEKAYLSQLEILMKYFVEPLKENAIIDDDNHSALFGQIGLIYNLNGEFLRELERNMDNVAQAFLKMAPFFKLYSAYAFDYRNALLVLQYLTTKNAGFFKFLEQTESRPEVQRKLNSLMIVPIQRVPRYKLLLEQVLLYTSPADADFKLLKESVKQIESTVSYINSCIEDQETTQFLINLQNSLVNRTPNIVIPSRKVIKEGVLEKVTCAGNSIKRYCVLMSDMFMYCKILKDRMPNTVVENSLKCRCIFPLKKCKVYELFPGNFKVTCQGDGIIFSTSDVQLSRAWVGFIRDAIDMHIQCRQTLRKESSKRKPIRRKDIKNFDADAILSPSKKKCDYETIFHYKNPSSDSEPENSSMDAGSTGCFSRRKSSVSKQQMPQMQMPVVTVPVNRKALKRPAPQPPRPTVTSEVCTKFFEAESCRPSQHSPMATTNRISKLYKFIANDKTHTHSILKKCNETAASSSSKMFETDYKFCDANSYFRAHNVDNTLPTTVKRDDLLEDTLDGDFRDVLFPLRSSGGSQKSGAQGWSIPKQKENGIEYLPPKKKRVKFNEQQSTVKPQAYGFPMLSSEKDTKGTKLNLSRRERIYEFFANLFKKN